MRSLILVGTLIYLSGLVLYSALFIFSANQAALTQITKIFVAGAHSLILIVPVVLAQSQVRLLRWLGYGLIAIYFGFAIFLVGYFVYFGFVPELYTFDLANAQELSEVSGHYFRQVFGWRELTLVGVFIALIWSIKRLTLPRYSLVVAGISAILLATSVYHFGRPSDSTSFGNATVLRRFGPVVFTYLSLSERLNASEEYLAGDTAYPGKIRQLGSAGDVAPQALVNEIPTVNRVIIVQIESFDAIAIDATLSDMPVMPFISGLRKTCLNYRNFFTMKGAGGSSDAEFSIATGLVPSARLPSLKHMNFARIETLYERLQANGIASSFSHNNQSGFYSRHKAYAQIEDLKTRFTTRLEVTSEGDFARSALRDTLRSSDRSLHYFFNFQSHGPYQGYSDETRRKYALNSNEDIRTDYLATMSEVDQMIEELFDLQESGFKSGENLFIVIADHPSGLHLSDDPLDKYRIPAMLCHRDFDGADVVNVFGTIDLHPTILEAFGIAADAQYLGESMFWGNPNAVLIPQRKIISLTPEGIPEMRSCGRDCDVFFDYTGQYLRF